MAIHPPGWGEPAPFFTGLTDGVERYSIEVAAGRWMVLMVFGSLASPAGEAAHARVIERRALFDDRDTLFYGVTVDASDRMDRNLCNSEPGLRYFWDFEHTICHRLGVIKDDFLLPTVFLIDRSFRIAMSAPIEAVDQVLDALEDARAEETGAAETPAPVLVAPRIFEPEFCQTLIAYFRSMEAVTSGFAIDVDGRTVTHIAPHLKRRSDVSVADEGLLEEIAERMRLRLLPMVERSFGWRATYIERFLICRYHSEDQGFFSAHRDNVTIGTAHRKFAVSINLNTGDYEGGEVRFPEFGARLYALPLGGAAVFACGLLHEVKPVTAGVRYTLVPFLYDEDGEATRAAHLSRVDGAVPAARRVVYDPV